MHYLKFILLIIILNVITNKGYSQCTKPSNKPASVVLVPKDNSISGTITPDAAGSILATGYLVVVDPSPAFATLPSDDKQYSSATPLGNSQFVYSGNLTTFEAATLSKNTTYFFYIFAYTTSAGGKICYNTNALIDNKPTTNGTQSGGGGSGDKPKAATTLSPLLDFNFTGKKNTWSNLTPVIFYGWSFSKDAKRNKKNKGSGTDKKVQLWGNTFQVGPYIGSSIKILDSTSYLPAIMLPGNAGLQVNYFMTLFKEEKFSIVICPINFGLKVVSGFADSMPSVIQHNIRHSIGFRFADYISASVQYTTGWHNSTTFSQENFGKIFKNGDLKVAYWNIGLTTRLSENLFGSETDKKAPMYLTINWRSMAKPKEHYNLPNSRIITLGLTTTLNLKSGSNPGESPRIPNF